MAGCTTAVGVPLTRPLSSMDNPAGRLPSPTTSEKVIVPLLATICCE